MFYQLSWGGVFAHNLCLEEPPGALLETASTSAVLSTRPAPLSPGSLEQLVLFFGRKEGMLFFQLS